MPSSDPAVNPHRGEVALVIDGVPRRMRLTLGALASLEAQLEAGSLMGLAERFETGQLATRDLLALLTAGLYGAGEPVSADDLAQSEIEGGAVAATRAGLELLSWAFRPVGDDR